MQLQTVYQPKIDLLQEKFRSILFALYVMLSQKLFFICWFYVLMFYLVGRRLTIFRFMEISILLLNGFNKYFSSRIMMKLVLYLEQLRCYGRAKLTSYGINIAWNLQKCSIQHTQFLTNGEVFKIAPSITFWDIYLKRTVKNTGAYHRQEALRSTLMQPSLRTLLAIFGLS